MNDFQIISKLGEGAYSTVFKVKRNIDNKIYALKKVKLLNLSQKEKENSLNEVRILASVKSNFVVSYKEAFFDEKDNTLCIVMEFADRGDLYQKIVLHKKNAKFFEESDIWRIFIQLVKGLKALHDLKILHRDMKSANVFLFSNGSAKLGDLNVSKVARKGLGYTQTGTPYYASPEVWKDNPYNNKSDVWSLGCVLYEMITLRPPFRAQDMEGLYNKVCKGQYSRIPERFSDDLFTIVQFLLQVNPNTRPSCEQILNHPVVMKRIEYFKSFAGEEEIEDNYLLKTIKIPKNLLFLSDKLPKPNYDKQFKSTNDGMEDTNPNNNNNYRSCNKINISNDITKLNNITDIKNNKAEIHIKKPIKLMPLINIPEEVKEKSNRINKENCKINFIQNRNRNISSNDLIINLSNNSNNNISNKLRLRKEELYYLDILSKQKNDLRRLMSKNNNNMNKKKNYINNSQLSPSAIKDINKILPSIINKSAPKKINNIKLMSNNYNRNKYIYNPSYIKNNERYQKKTSVLDYDYGNIISLNNINIRDEGGIIQKMPRRLNPLKKPPLYKN